MRLLLALAAATALSACAPTMKAAPAGPFTAAPVTVTLDRNWSAIPPQLNGMNGTVLTRHGVALERVDLLSLAPGDAMMRTARNVDAPRYRAGMSELELVEFVTASLARMGFTDVQAQNVRPYTLAGAPGVRFGLTGKYESGLNARGDIALAPVSGKLSVIMYLAPAAHYYEANAEEFEHLVQSARTAG